MNKKTGTLLRQLAFPMLLMLLCYINLQYMHYTVLMDKYSLTTFSYVENIFHTLADVCLFFLPPTFPDQKEDISFLYSLCPHHASYYCQRAVQQILLYIYATCIVWRGQ